MDNSLLLKINELEQSILVSKGRRDTLVEVLKGKEEELVSINKTVDALEESIQFLTKTAKKARDNTIKNIESLSTMSVQSVYVEPIEINLQYRDKSKTDSSDKLNLQLVRRTPDAIIVTGLMDEVGGGMIETVSFALRIASIKWLNYKGPIILDEAYKSVSNDEKLDNIALLLKELKSTVGNQIIFATHKQDVFGEIASKEFVVTYVNAVSEVAEC